MTMKLFSMVKGAAGRSAVIIGGGMCLAALWSGNGGLVEADAAPTRQNIRSVCFPTCAVDGRFLVVAGNDPTTLAAAHVTVGLSVPVVNGFGMVDFDLFDGDRDSSGWDVNHAATKAAAPELEIELYADPAGTGASGPLIKKWAPGEIPFVNGDWTGVSLPHDTRALTSPESVQRFNYSLKISAASPDVDLGWNAFKIRTHARLELPSQAFGFIGAMAVPGDLPAIYPDYPELSGSTYDGTWTFTFRVPAGVDNVTIFDGDMDYGDTACTINDTDDPDSTGVPAFGAGAADEGVASADSPCTDGVGIRTGRPAEDSASAAFSRVPILPGSPSAGIVYRVVAPDGQTFLNRNPSGNREWEQFRIVRAASPGAEACPEAGFADHDCETTALPGGLWEVQVDGMDLSNLNFLFLNYTIER